MTKLSNPRKHGKSDVVRAARLSVAPMMDRDDIRFIIQFQNLAVYGEAV